MARRNTGISIDEEVLSRFDKIREAIEDDDPFDRKPDRSKIIENLLITWNEENSHYLDDIGGEDDSGNPVLAPMSS